MLALQSCNDADYPGCRTLCTVDWECGPSSSSPSLVGEKSSIKKNVTSSNILKSFKSPKKHNQTYLLLYTKKKKRRRNAQMIFCRNQETISVLEKNEWTCPNFFEENNKTFQRKNIVSQYCFLGFEHS